MPYGITQRNTEYSENGGIRIMAGLGTERKADLAEELKRLNDMLASDRGSAIPNLNNILDCGGISAVKTLTTALDEHTREMRRMSQIMVEHTEEMRRHSMALTCR